MGILKNGPLGALVGTTGGITSYVLKGQNVTRAKSEPRTKPLSKKQLANCQKMTVLNEFFDDILLLLKAGFGIEAKDTKYNYHNIATSYNKINALKGEYPNIEMDYPKVLISKGNLMPPEEVTLELVTEGIKFNWHTDGWKYNNGADQAMMLAFDPENKNVSLVVYGAHRSQGFDVLPLPKKMKNKALETYLSFISADRQTVATSVYTGQIGEP